MTERDIVDVLRRDRLRSVRSAVDRYDLLLAAIPLALLGGVLAGDVLGVPFEVALVFGAAAAVLAVVDGVFLRPPTGPGTA